MIRLRRTIAACTVGLVAAITALTGYESPRPADAAAPRATAAPTATLLVLGDSLTWGSNYFAKLHARLSAQGTFDIVIVDGWWSRRIGGITSTRYSGVNTFRALRKSGVTPAAVIVGLGTNDVQFLGRPAQYAPLIEELVAEIGPVPVAWLNVHRVETATTTRRSRIFNRTLAAVAERNPNLSVVDWASLVSATPRLMAFDKIHLQPSGYEARTRVVLDVATELWNRHVAATTPPPSPETSPETSPESVPESSPDTSTTTVPANG